MYARTRNPRPRKTTWGQGHYAGFDFLTYDLRLESNLDMANQIFGPENIEAYVPTYTKGRDQGKFKGTLVMKVCNYGGCVKGTRAIAKPDDVPMIAILPMPFYKVHGCDEELRDLKVLGSGQIGTYAYTKEHPHGKMLFPHPNNK